MQNSLLSKERAIMQRSKDPISQNILSIISLTFPNRFMKELFREARESQPACIVFENLDGIFSHFKSGLFSFSFSYSNSSLQSGRRYRRYKENKDGILSPNDE